MFSNRNLAIIALVLFVGAAGDGLLYNRPPANATVYPLQDPRHIEIKYRQNIVITLHRADDGWLVTEPFHAPASPSRVALLLDSNSQTARSYRPEDLQKPDATLLQSFPDPVELRVDGNLFLIGDIEPVSQLRYVSANNQVYLQADHIVPLLQSLQSTFTNLKIVNAVQSVELRARTAAVNTSDKATVVKSTAADSAGDWEKSAMPVSAVQLSHWNNLDALTVINAALLEHRPFAAVTVFQQTGDPKRFDIFRFQQQVALRQPESEFAYLISQQQAENLGICVYC